MSVFGGDSWAREAQNRKRRVDDLIIDGVGESSFRKLSTGKFACLVCPHNPILDTSLMLSMHIKGSRHRSAESRLKERELALQDEKNKRTALSESGVGIHKLERKPLIEKARKAASEIIAVKNQASQLNATHDSESGMLNSTNGVSVCLAESPSMEVKASAEEALQQRLNVRDRRERELKFIAAGWKRDFLGKWLRDENVEFDSDEEDPNVCLA